MALELMPGWEPIEMAPEPPVKQAVKPTRVFNWNIPAQPACLPPVPVLPPDSPVRGWEGGRYDFHGSTRPDVGLQGVVRWRQPGTLHVMDEEGCRQWTYTEELPDGTLIDEFQRRWVPFAAQPVGMIPGHYEGASGVLNNAVRWRVPGEMCVRDEHGHYQWTFDLEEADGTLVQISTGLKWVPQQP